MSNLEFNGNLWDILLFLDFSLKEFGLLDTVDRLKCYWRNVYAAGAVNRSEKPTAFMIVDTDCPRDFYPKTIIKLVALARDQNLAIRCAKRKSKPKGTSS